MIITSSSSFTLLSLKAAHKCWKSILWVMYPVMFLPSFSHSRVSDAYGIVLLIVWTLPVSSMIEPKVLKALTRHSSPSIWFHSLSFQSTIADVLWLMLILPRSNIPIYGTGLSMILPGSAYRLKLESWHYFGVKVSGTGRDMMGLQEENGVLKINAKALFGTCGDLLGHLNLESEAWCL